MLIKLFEYMELNFKNMNYHNTSFEDTLILTLFFTYKYLNTENHKPVTIRWPGSPDTRQTVVLHCAPFITCLEEAVSRVVTGRECARSAHHSESSPAEEIAWMFADAPKKLRLP